MLSIHPSSRRRYPDMCLLRFPLDGLHHYWYTSTNAKMIQAVKRWHFIMLFLSTFHPPIWVWWVFTDGKQLVCHPLKARPMRENRTDYGEMSGWLSSHKQETFKACWTNVREKIWDSLRPEAINQPIISGNQALCYDNRPWKTLVPTHL